MTELSENVSDDSSNMSNTDKVVSTTAVAQTPVPTIPAFSLAELSFKGVDDEDEEEEEEEEEEDGETISLDVGTWARPVESVAAPKVTAPTVSTVVQPEKVPLVPPPRASSAGNDGGFSGSNLLSPLSAHSARLSPRSTATGPPTVVKEEGKVFKVPDLPASALLAPPGSGASVVIPPRKTPVGGHVSPPKIVAPENDDSSDDDSDDDDDDKKKSPLSDTLDLFPMISSHQRVSAPSSSSTAPNPRRKVPLTPGHSPLDWARLLTTSPASLLRGPSHTRLERYTLTQIREHRSRTDVWMAIRGKVYNCTSYVKFHPGGAGQLMRGAGKDATELFMKVHPWVNVDGLLEKCCVGYLVPEEPTRS